jgi:hypothetical protein
MTREADSSTRFLAAVMKIEELGWLVAFLESSRKRIRGGTAVRGKREKW